MGIFDAFRKEEVNGTKVLVCQLGTTFDEPLKSDLRVYKRFYARFERTFTTVAELRGAAAHSYDVLHVFCDVGQEGALSDASGDRITGNELLKAATDSGVKLLWIGSDNPQEVYDAGFKTKGLKLNVVLTLRRLGSNTSLFLDNLLTKMPRERRWRKRGVWPRSRKGSRCNRTFPYHFVVRPRRGRAAVICPTSSEGGPVQLLILVIPSGARNLLFPCAKKVLSTARS